MLVYVCINGKIRSFFGAYMSVKIEDKYKNMRQLGVLHS